MTELCILGVDPGLSGAIAFYFPSRPGLISAEDIPVAGNEVDAASLAARCRQLAPSVAIVELVASMPKQGVASTFRFGQAFGTARGVIAALEIPTHLVAPTRWKRHFQLSADKEGARALALRLWPSRADIFGRKRDHGRAEAALLARYGAEVILLPEGGR